MSLDTLINQSTTYKYITNSYSISLYSSSVHLLQSSYVYCFPKNSLIFLLVLGLQCLPTWYSLGGQWGTGPISSQSFSLGKSLRSKESLQSITVIWEKAKENVFFQYPFHLDNRIAIYTFIFFLWVSHVYYTSTLKISNGLEFRSHFF